MNSYNFKDLLQHMDNHDRVIGNKRMSIQSFNRSQPILSPCGDEDLASGRCTATPMKKSE